MSLFAELRRRNIFRVALCYIAVGWLLAELCDLLVTVVALPGWIYRFTVAVLIIAFPLALVLSWIYELTPEGLRREFEVDPAHSITRQTGRRLLALTGLAMLGVLALNLLRFALV